MTYRGAELTAEQVHAIAARSIAGACQAPGGVHGVGDHRQAHVRGQGFGDQRRGAAGVHEKGLAVFDQGGHLSRDRTLLAHACFRAHVDRRLALFHQHRAAVHAADIAQGLQLHQVPANGFARYVQLRHDAFNRNMPVDLQHAADQAIAIFMPHVDSF